MAFGFDPMVPAFAPGPAQQPSLPVPELGPILLGLSADLRDSIAVHLDIASFMRLRPTNCRLSDLKAPNHMGELLRHVFTDDNPSAPPPKYLTDRGDSVADHGDVVDMLAATVRQFPYTREGLCYTCLRAVRPWCPIPPRSYLAAAHTSVDCSMAELGNALATRPKGIPCESCILDCSMQELRQLLATPPKGPPQHGSYMLTTTAIRPSPPPRECCMPATPLKRIPPKPRKIYIGKEPPHVACCFKRGLHLYWPSCLTVSCPEIFCDHRGPAAVDTVMCRDCGNDDGGSSTPKSSQTYYVPPQQAAGKAKGKARQRKMRTSRQGKMRTSRQGKMQKSRQEKMQKWQDAIFKACQEATSKVGEDTKTIAWQDGTFKSEDHGGVQFSAGPSGFGNGTRAPLTTCAKENAPSSLEGHGGIKFGLGQGITFHPSTRCWWPRAPLK